MQRQLDTVLSNLIKHQRFEYEDIFGLRFGWIASEFNNVYECLVLLILKSHIFFTQEKLHEIWLHKHLEVSPSFTECIEHWCVQASSRWTFFVNNQISQLFSFSDLFTQFNYCLVILKFINMCFFVLICFTIGRAVLMTWKLIYTCVWFETWLWFSNKPKVVRHLAGEQQQHTNMQ